MHRPRASIQRFAYLAGLALLCAAGSAQAVTLVRDGFDRKTDSLWRFQARAYDTATKTSVEAAFMRNFAVSGSAGNNFGFIHLDTARSAVRVKGPYGNPAGLITSNLRIFYSGYRDDFYVVGGKPAHSVKLKGSGLHQTDVSKADTVEGLSYLIKYLDSTGQAAFARTKEMVGTDTAMLDNLTLISVDSADITAPGIELPAAVRDSAAKKVIGVGLFGALLIKSTHYNRETLEIGMFEAFGTVEGPALVFNRPEDAVITAGDSVRLGVSVLGSEPINYKFYAGDSLLADTTSDAMWFKTTLADTGVYKIAVVATNSQGSSTSDTAMVTVKKAEPAMLTRLLADTLLLRTQPFEWAVTASGSGPFSFQWYKNGTALEGATGAAIDFDALSAADTGAYFVVVTNRTSLADTSDTARLDIREPLPVSITTQPIGDTVLVGMTVTFTVQVEGDGPFAYQWYGNGQPIRNATRNEFKVKADSLGMNGGIYTVIVRNPVFGNAHLFADTSEAAVLSVVNPPQISSQPQAVSIKEGEAAAFQVTASGTGTLSYQWYKDGSAIEGANLPNLDLNTTVASDSGDYKVIVTDAVGSDTSVVARLSIEVAVGILGRFVDRRGPVHLRGNELVFNHPASVRLIAPDGRTAWARTGRPGQAFAVDPNLVRSLERGSLRLLLDRLPE